MRKLGNFCIFLGFAMILSAAVLFLRNHTESARAAAQSSQIVSQLQTYQAEIPMEDTQPVPDPYDPAMTEVEIDGNKYIGYLQLPNMEEMLPVMSDWSYPQLQIAPCRFHGSAKTDNLVLMAHNYPKHFGNLGQLSVGDEIHFLDMDDFLWKYQVVARETLPADAVEDMNAGEFDLTLFTCTYGGQSRVTIRCDRILED